MIASASLFDEYTNDLLYLQEGSCFPRYVTLVVLLSNDLYDSIAWYLVNCTITFSHMDSQTKISGACRLQFSIASFKGTAGTV